MPAQLDIREALTIVDTPSSSGVAAAGVLIKNLPAGSLSRFKQNHLHIPDASIKVQAPVFSNDPFSGQERKLRYLCIGASISFSVFHYCLRSYCFYSADPLTSLAYLQDYPILCEMAAGAASRN